MRAALYRVLFHHFHQSDSTSIKDNSEPPDTPPFRRFAARKRDSILSGAIVS
jgi:hypothetical protein